MRIKWLNQPLYSSFFNFDKFYLAHFLRSRVLNYVVYLYLVISALLCLIANHYFAASLNRTLGNLREDLAKEGNYDSGRR